MISCSLIGMSKYCCVKCLLYSPNRRSFITKTATTNFKADEFTDPVGEWLKHLCSVVADCVVLWYGMVCGMV